MKARLSATILILLVILMGASHIASAATSTVSTILAAEDTYVDSAKPTTNYGGIVTLWIRGGTPVRRALLRFDLSTIPAGAQISSAILRMSVSSDGSSVAGTVSSVGGSWSQNTVTYATAPTMGAALASLPNPASPGSTVSVDLTSYVMGKTAVNLYLATSSSDGVVYYSREKGTAYSPRLIITWSSSPTPQPTGSVQLSPTALASRTSTPSPVFTATRTPTPFTSATPTFTRTATSTSVSSATPTFTRTATATPIITASPTPTQGASSTPPGDSVKLPLRLAFYYPSYPESWTLGSVYPYSNYTPTLGFYDSSDASVIAQHIAWMQYAGIQGGIAFWDGPATPSDGRIPALLAQAAGSGFKWTLYYKPEGSGNPTAPAITSDLLYISSHYAQAPNFLRIGGKPVLFVYADATDGCAMADRWKAANTPGFYLVLKVFAGYSTCASQPGNWHQFGPAVHNDVQGTHSVTISPGYWQKGSSPLLSRDLVRWNQDIASMLAAHPDFQLLTTWNGWAEGTMLEPSVELGTSFMDALHNNGALTPTPQPTPGGSDPAIMAAGDIICDSLTTTSAGCQQMAVSQLAVDAKPGAALILGDLCHTPSVDCFNNYFAPSWGRLFSISRPVTGNHDYLVAGALYYFDYWNGVGNAAGRAGDRDKAYYSYDVGQWHLIALNSQCEQVGGCGSTSTQYKWLEQDLQGHPNLCTLAYYHIPVFSSGGRAAINMQQIYALLYRYGADVILDGHDHIYERFAPQDSTGVADPVGGIREFIVGTGGANHTTIATVQPNSEVRNADTFGVLKLTLHASSYDWQFIPVAGKTFTDSGSTPCH